MAWVCIPIPSPMKMMTFFAWLWYFSICNICWMSEAPWRRQYFASLQWKRYFSPMLFRKCVLCIYLRLQEQFWNLQLKRAIKFEATFLHQTLCLCCCKTEISFMNLISSKVGNTLELDVIAVGPVSQKWALSWHSAGLGSVNHRCIVCYPE